MTHIRIISDGNRCFSKYRNDNNNEVFKYKKSGECLDIMLYTYPLQVKKEYFILIIILSEYLKNQDKTKRLYKFYPTVFICYF
jgi:hypothetical protein